MQATLDGSTRRRNPQPLDAAKRFAADEPGRMFQTVLQATFKGRVAALLQEIERIDRDGRPRIGDDENTAAAWFPLHDLPAGVPQRARDDLDLLRRDAPAVVGGRVPSYCQGRGKAAR